MQMHRDIYCTYNFNVRKVCSRAQRHTLTRTHAHTRTLTHTHTQHARMLLSIHAYVHIQACVTTGMRVGGRGKRDLGEVDLTLGGGVNLGVSSGLSLCFGPRRVDDGACLLGFSKEFPTSLNLQFLTLECIFVCSLLKVSASSQLLTEAKTKSL